MMRRFRVPAKVYGYVEVEGEDFQDAIDHARAGKLKFVETEELDIEWIDGYEVDENGEEIWEEEE